MVGAIHFEPVAGFQRQKIQLSNEEVFLLDKIKKPGKGAELKKALPQATPIQLAHVLQAYCADLVGDAAVKDPIATLDRLTKLLPLDKLQEAVKDDFGDVLNEAKNMFEEAKLYLNTNEVKMPKAKRTKLYAMLDKVVKVLESLIAAFGIGDFFKAADNAIQADMKSSKIMLLMGLFSGISALLLPLLGPVVAGVVVGGIFLTLAVLSLVWPYIKPMPTHLPTEAKNLTQAAQRGDFVSEGRKEVLDEIANIMKMGRHAFLLGPSRVGKSSTASAFAEAVARGDYPELEGKVVFRIDTTALINYQTSFMGGSNPILREISAAMGRHRNNIILVFDEIHVACQGKEKLADQLKSFLDEKGDFPHVIGITTKEEYDRDILGAFDINKKNIAFAQRFDMVNIENTGPDETLKVLSNIVLKNSSKPILEEGVLQEIYDQTQALGDAPQPATSAKVLKKCIVKAEVIQKTPTERKIIKVTNKIESLLRQGAANRGKNRVAKEPIVALRNKLDALQKKAAEEKSALERLNQSKTLFDRVTKNIYATSIVVSAIAGKKLSDKDENQMKRLILLNQFMAKALEHFMEEKSQELGVRKVIGKAMVREVVQEYKLEQERKQRKAEEAQAQAAE